MGLAICAMLGVLGFAALYLGAGDSCGSLEYPAPCPVYLNPVVMLPLAVILMVLAPVVFIVGVRRLWWV